MKDDEEFTLRCSDLVDTVHSARIIVATKGAIVVSVQIQETVYKGVLLDITNSRSVINDSRVTTDEGVSKCVQVSCVGEICIELVGWQGPIMKFKSTLWFFL